MSDKERGIGKFVKENKTWIAIGVPSAVLGSYLLIKHLQEQSKDSMAKEVLGKTATEMMQDYNASLGANAVHPVSENAAQDINGIKGKERKRIVRDVNRIAKVLKVPDGMKTLAEKIACIALVTGEKIKEVWEKEKNTK